MIAMPSVVEQIAEELCVDPGVTMSPLPHLGSGDPWAMEEEEPKEEEAAALPGTATPLVAEALESEVETTPKATGGNERNRACTARTWLWGHATPEGSSENKDRSGHY